MIQTVQEKKMDEKMDEKERKKREIRERLEAQMKSSNKKKGFMTPERKKRLRVSRLMECLWNKQFNTGYIYVAIASTNSRWWGETATRA